MRKPVQKWTNQDVMAWLEGLGTWPAAQNITKLFQAEVCILTQINILLLGNIVTVRSIWKPSPVFVCLLVCRLHMGMYVNMCQSTCHSNEFFVVLLGYNWTSTCHAQQGSSWGDWGTQFIQTRSSRASN